MSGLHETPASVPALKLTAPQLRALRILATKGADRDWTSAEFAELMWPGKFVQRINGPRGLGPTAGPMAGGRMLRTLRMLGLVRRQDRGKYYTHSITLEARLLASGFQGIAE